MLEILLQTLYVCLYVYLRGHPYIHISLLSDCIFLHFIANVAHHCMPIYFPFHSACFHKYFASSLFLNVFLFNSFIHCYLIVLMFNTYTHVYIHKYLLTLSLFQRQNGALLTADCCVAPVALH